MAKPPKNLDSLLAGLQDKLNKESLKFQKDLMIYGHASYTLPSSSKAYLCVGGPLHGQMAVPNAGGEHYVQELSQKLPSIISPEADHIQNHTMPIKTTRYRLESIKIEDATGMTYGHWEYALIAEGVKFDEAVDYVENHKKL